MEQPHVPEISLAGDLQYCNCRGQNILLASREPDDNSQVPKVQSHLDLHDVDRHVDAFAGSRRAEVRGNRNSQEALHQIHACVHHLLREAKVHASEVILCIALVKRGHHG